MSSLKITLAATNAFSKWLNLDMPRTESPDGKRIGTQPFVTNTGSIAWQCTVIQNFHKRGTYTAITVEA